MYPYTKVHVQELPENELSEINPNSSNKTVTYAMTGIPHIIHHTWDNVLVPGQVTEIS